MPEMPCCRSKRLGRALQRRIRRAASSRRGDTAATNAKRGSDRDEHGRAGDPPRLAEPAGEEHHDEQGDADRDERAAELEPVAERPVEVARLGQVVAARPPEVEQPERELDEPDDPEPEHAEQHAGADRPGGRLAREAGAAAGVDPERREQRDLPEHPGDEEEALDARRPRRTRRLAEDGVDVDCGEVQAGRHRRAEEQRRADEPGRGRGDDERPSGRGGSGRLDSRCSRRRLEVELELLVPRPVADGRRGVRVAVGEQEQVGVDLSRVAEADGAEVAQPFRHAPRDEGGPPAEQRRRARRRPCTRRRASARGWRARAGRA